MVTRFAFVLGMLSDSERLGIEQVVANSAALGDYLERALEEIPVTAGPGFLRLLIRRFGLLSHEPCTLPTLFFPGGQVVDAATVRAGRISK